MKPKRKAVSQKAEIGELKERVRALEMRYVCNVITRVADGRIVQNGVTLFDSDITSAFRDAIRGASNTVGSYDQFAYRDGKFYFHDQDLSPFETAIEAVIAVRKLFGMPKPAWGVTKNP